MSENPTPVTPQPAEGRPTITSSGTSRLALLISFVAGAFAAWIIISANIF